MSLRLIRVIDTETTGLPDGDKQVDIVEIGYTDVLEDFSGKLVVVDDAAWCAMLVRPTVPISFGAMGVHHITEEMAAAGTTRAAAIEIIKGADIYAAHNAAFDQPLLGLGAPGGAGYVDHRAYPPAAFARIDGRSDGRNIGQSNAPP